MDDSDVSSALSDILSDLSSVPSSPLSSLAGTPEPPDHARLGSAPRAPVELPYPSPPASQQTSQTGSPTPDGMDTTVCTDTDGPPPAKRRRISREPKERTTQYLDLRSGTVLQEQQEQLDRILGTLHKRQKIVVIAGAGMSKSAGVPDFRSKHGLFSTLKKEHNLKGSGQHLFDASVYKDDASTLQFHQMITQMSRLVKGAKPTPFHHMLATIAAEGRLLRLYSQNVDCLETGLEPLKTRIPLTKDEHGKWPRTLQLHGGLDKMVCTKCSAIFDFDASLFGSSDAPPCPTCEEVNDLRTSFQGKRSHGIGRLRPRMVLYHEDGPDGDAIGHVTAADLKRKPDAVLVVGTTLKVKGLQRIVKEMCNTVRDRKDGGLAIWINPELPPVAGGFRDMFDIIVQGTCDEVANRAAMPRWDELTEPNEFNEVSEDEAAIAASMKVEVSVPFCGLTEAAYVKPPTDAHCNNSFRPPPASRTSMRNPDSLRPTPGDWSPIPRRSASVVPTIEKEAVEGDTIKVAHDGLLTPSKSRHSTPASTKKAARATPVASLNDKLRAAAQQKKQPASKNHQHSLTAKQAQPKKKTVKYVKPALSQVKAKGSAKGSAGQNGKPKPQTRTITSSFMQSKAASIQAKEAASKGKLSLPFKSPSKLRQVSNTASHEPMAQIPERDARVNKSPEATMVSFPGLLGMK